MCFGQVFWKISESSGIQLSRPCRTKRSKSLHKDCASMTALLHTKLGKCAPSLGVSRLWTARSLYSHRYKSIIFYNATFQVHPHREFSGVCNFPVGCCKFSSPSGWDQPDFCLASALKRWLKQTMDPGKKWYTHVHSNPNVWKIRLHTCFESHGPSLNFICGPKTI